jgi:hypothetical protein
VLAALAVARDLTVVVPGLRGPAPGARLPAFDRLAARARRAPSWRQWDAGLSGLFALGPEAADLPVAALTLLHDTGERRAGYWLRADPVHIEAGQDRLIMAGSEPLGLGREEAAALCAEVNEHMRPDGIEFIAPTATRWYFTWPEPLAIRFSPLPEVVGQDLYEYMPAGEAGRPWRRLLNQVQMVLHISRVNEERRLKHRPEVNGLWFWGGGALPPVRPAGFVRVWGDDALVRGLAMNAGAASEGLPDGAVDWLARAEAGAHLVVDLEPWESLRADDPDNWRALAAGFDARWLEPLREALRRGDLDRLVLCPGDGSEYHVTRREWRRWWRWW